MKKLKHILIMTILVCWAVQGLAQPTRAKGLYGTVGECVVIYTTTRAGQEKVDSLKYDLSVKHTAWNIFSMKASPAVFPSFDSGYRLGGKIDVYDIDPNKATVRILQQPRHGRLSENSFEDISYYPDTEYAGKDKAIFLVKMEGYNIKVVYYLNVFDSKKQNSIGWKTCRSTEPWQISKSSYSK